MDSGTKMASHHLQRPLLMFVSDRTILQERSFVDVATAAARGGTNVVQIREPGVAAREVLKLIARLREVLAQSVTLVINDRLDVALASGADGVQLGAGSIPVEAARRIAPDLLIGASIHGVPAAVQAEAEGADYLVVGTMFATRSHPGKAPEGLALMQQVREAVRLPLIGIGGITAQNAGAVMQAGADGVAVISEILAAEDPEQAAQRLRTALD